MLFRDHLVDGLGTEHEESDAKHGAEDQAHQADEPSSGEQHASTTNDYGQADDDHAGCQHEGADLTAWLGVEHESPQCETTQADHLQ